MPRSLGSRLVAVVAMALAAVGCSSADEPEVATIETVSGFAGIAVADEPRAALVGRDILGNNGNAADAAVAMAFAMTVTMPSRVGLGGGGACLVHRRRDKTVEALLFLPGEGENGASVPGVARGMAALHARHGLQGWAQVVSPAERLARFGNQVSRAFHGDLVRMGGALAPEAQAAFRRADGSLPRVGDRIELPELSAVLAGIRGQGAGYLHVGNFSARLAEAAAAQGEPLTRSDLREYAASFAEPLQVPFDEHRLYLPPPPATGGLSAAQAWAMARQRSDLSDPTSPRRAHFLVEAWKRALSQRRAWLDASRMARPAPADLVTERHVRSLMQDYDAQRATPAAALRPQPVATAGAEPTAGFAVSDRFGNLTACTFTMNGLFGSGKVAGGTGILLAGRRAPERAGAGLAPALVANPFTGIGYLAASAAGGGPGQAALAQTLVQLPNLGETFDRRAFPTGKTTPTRDLTDDEGPARVRLGDLLGAARLYHPGTPDVVLHEEGFPGAVLEGLRRRGHRLQREGGLGLLGALYCPRGAHNAPELCDQAADPRGHGLAVRAE